MAQMMKEWLMLSAGDVFQRFIPSEKGESLEEQIYPWSVEGVSRKVEMPLMPSEIDTKTMCHLLQMRAVEAQHWMDYRHYSMMVTDPDFKKLLGQIARAEHTHYWWLHSLMPPANNPSEAVLNSELAIIDSYDMCIQSEPNSDIRAAFEHIKSDHVMHAEYAARQAQSMGSDVNRFTGGMSLSGGRPLEQQFMKPEDTFWHGRMDGVYKKTDVDPMTLVNVDASIAGEIAAWSGYGCAAISEQDQPNRTHFAAFSSIEEQHVALLGSIKDPTETILESSLVHEQVEVQHYKKMMDHITNPRVKAVFEDLYEEDLEQARLFGEFAK